MKPIWKVQFKDYRHSFHHCCTVFVINIYRNFLLAFNQAAVYHPVENPSAKNVNREPPNPRCQMKNGRDSVNCSVRCQRLCVVAEVRRSNTFYTCLIQRHRQQPANVKNQFFSKQILLKLYPLGLPGRIMLIRCNGMARLSLPAIQ